MPIDPNSWTIKTSEAFNAAMSAARSGNAPEVTPDHLLVALLDQADGVVVPLLEKVGVDPRALRSTVATRLANGPKAYGSDAGMSRSLRDALERADAIRGDL